jgi:DNA repair exonuclease SbcCD ATPase subunit
MMSILLIPNHDKLLAKIQNSLKGDKIMSDKAILDLKRSLAVYETKIVSLEQQLAEAMVTIRDFENVEIQPLRDMIEKLAAALEAMTGGDLIALNQRSEIFAELAKWREQKLAAVLGQYAAYDSEGSTL